MLKRSLALGALMAFVITGQAWAADVNDINVDTTSISDHKIIKSVDGSITTLNSINADGTEHKVELSATGNIIVNGSVKAKGHSDVELKAGVNLTSGIFYATGGSKINAAGQNVEIVGYVTAQSGSNISLGDNNTENIKINGTKWGIYNHGNNSTTTVTSDNVNIYLESNSDDVIGITAIGGSVDAIANKVTINANKTIINVHTTATGVDVNGEEFYAAGLDASSKGELVVNGDLEINATAANENSAYAILAGGGSSVQVGGMSTTVQLNGDIYITKFDGNDYNGNVCVDLHGERSVLNGSVTAENQEAVTGMKLGLTDGATWNVTGDSFVNELNGTDGNVILKYEGVDNQGNVEVAKVDIGKNNNANLTVSGDETLTEAIEDGKVSADKALAALNESVDNEGNDSKAIATVKTAEGKILGSYVRNEDGTATLQESSKSAAVSEAGMNLKAHWRAHMNDMNKRMGELRFANGEAGVWTRMVRGESEYEGAKMQYNQYQLGYDEKLSVDKRWTVGAAVTFSEGDSNYSTGSSEDKSTAFAIYGSKLNNDGTFVDLIARYARLESDIEDRNYEKGEYDTNGMSVSAEFGKRIQQGNGLWIEPQVELTYGAVDSASVRFADGSVANYGDMDSFIGRVGFSMGKDIRQGNVYARASYLYDFDSETETTFTNGTVSGKPVEEDFGGGWWEVGVGANINLSKATYIYADIEKTFGGEVDTNWQWNLGVRYSF